LYIDNSGNRQGPFSTREMQQWYTAGFIMDSLQLRRVHETEYKSLGKFYPELKKPPKPLPVSQQQSFAPTPSPVQYYPYPSVPVSIYSGYNYLAPTPSVSGYPYGANPAMTQQSQQPADISGDYAQKVMFTSIGGRFKAQDSTAHWQTKGLATDKEGRQMSAFFDVEAYQEQMREKKERGEDKKKPVKLSRKQIDDLKEKKRQRKLKKILDI